MEPTEQEVLERVKARRGRASRRLLTERITLAHGAGGRSTQALIEALFLPELGNPLLAPLGDSALLDGALAGARLAFTTDSYVVRPLCFPGGDIATLAVNGTINDLAVAGARPLALSAAFIIEEGLETTELACYARSLGRAASAAGVPVATGDTKVVERGKADGLYITTAGVGVVAADVVLDPATVRVGDRILISGTLADHGMAVLVARGELELEAAIESDTAALHELTATLLEVAGDGLRWMRDPTRGGLATSLNELARATQLGVTLNEPALPLHSLVAGACEILGIDPLYVANEGKLVAVLAPDALDAALAAVRAHPLGHDAAAIGEIRAEPAGMVILETAFGGARVVDTLAGDPLPRIC